LVGQDGNVFLIIGKVSKALKKAGFQELADEYLNRTMSADSYDHVLQITMEYVNIE
jgi:hypothetical protein